MSFHIYVRSTPILRVSILQHVQPLVKDKSGRYWRIWKWKDKRSDDHHNTKALASNVADKIVMYWKKFAKFCNIENFCKKSMMFRKDWMRF